MSLEYAGSFTPGLGRFSPGGMTVHFSPNGRHIRRETQPTTGNGLILGPASSTIRACQRGRPARLTMSDHYIEFRNVNKAFEGPPVLVDVNFFVDRGETCVIMGRSGVGKSVTLKHILGFLRPDSGRVLVAGQDITDWTEDQLTEIRRRVTMVFQSGALFDSLTVAENIAFPLEQRTDMTDEQKAARIAELADELEVTAVADKLPSELSTGMKRAVAIARALAQDPEAILYDEPTTMVDPLMAAHTGDLILRLKKKFSKTSVVVTHDTHLAKKLADRIVFLHEGRVAYFGPWDGFVAAPEPYLRNFIRQDELIPELDVTS